MQRAGRLWRRATLLGPLAVAALAFAMIAASPASAETYFEVETQGEAPEDATFWGLYGPPNSEFDAVKLADPDGDGTYTGSADIPYGEYAVRLVQGTGERHTSYGPFPGEPSRVLKDYGTTYVTNNGGTFSAEADFGDERPAEYSRVVDNASERFTAPASWGYSGWNAERYGAGYRYAAPNTAYSDPASYRFDIPERDEYTVHAWWPSSPGYNTSTPVGVKTTEGWRWTTVDQSERGGRWVELGDFEMPAGDATNVLISRWTGDEGYVVADAVKVERK